MSDHDDYNNDDDSTRGNKLLDAFKKDDTNKQRYPSADELKAMSDEQQLEHFMATNGHEFTAILNEYKDKRSILNTMLMPLYTAIRSVESTNRRTVFEQQIHSAIALFSSYLLNILFYVHLKSRTLLSDSLVMLSNNTQIYAADQHPVIDAIIAQRKKITIVEQYLERNHTRLMAIVQRFKQHKSVAMVVAQSDYLSDIISGMKGNNMSNNNGQVVANNEPREASLNDEHLDEHIYSGGDEDDEHIESDDCKRAITSEIEKNKGLAVKRKKGTQHSRVKKRKQFQKALIKKRSQRADPRKELTPYSGEPRGIRVSTVKSIKLKA